MMALLCLISKIPCPLNKLSFKRASAEIGSVFYHMLFVKEKNIYIYSMSLEILIFELFIEIKFIELI